MRISMKLLTAGVVFFALLMAFFGCQKDEASVDTSGETLSKTWVYQRDSKGNEEKRILGEVSCFNTGFYSEVSAVTKHQKRGFLGSWVADVKTNLTVKGTVSWLRLSVVSGTIGVCDGEQTNFSTSKGQVNELKHLIDSKTFSCNYIINGPTNAHIHHILM